MKIKPLLSCPEFVAGDTIYIPPRSIQFIHNNGSSNLVFLCIVDPAWRKEDEIVNGKSMSYS